MITTAIRNAANLSERLARRFQGWADNLPDEPFDRILPAALALAEKSEGFLAAEIGVPVARVELCIEADAEALSIEEHKDVGRFFSRRGIHDVRLLAWFGWRIIAWHPMTTAREAAISLEAQATAGRIVQFQREAGLRR